VRLPVDGKPPHAPRQVASVVEPPIPVAAGKLGQFGSVNLRALDTMSAGDRWPAGAQVMLRHVVGDRTWALVPVMVLRDTAEATLLRIIAGSLYLAPHDDHLQTATGRARSLVSRAPGAGVGVQPDQRLIAQADDPLSAARLQHL